MKGAARFRLLGPMAITLDERARPLPAAAERALLAQLLLAAGRVVPATTLIDRLWTGASAPVDPVNALQTRVSKLRRSLAAIGLPDLVVREGVGYRAVVSPEVVDAVAFARRVHAARADNRSRPAERCALFEQALALWSGQPLVDFVEQSWATSETSRLRSLRLAALVEWAELASALGRETEVVRQLGPVVAEDPAQEALAGQLMTALYRAGQQADALEVFARTRSHLVDELGLEPSESLRLTHALVLRQDPSLTAQRSAAETGHTAAAAGRAGVPTNLPTVERPLIGRGEALGDIAELLEGSRLVTLVGPGGAGKTSLAMAASVRAAPHFADGVFGVRLGQVDAPERVPGAIAEALEVPPDSSGVVHDVTSHVLGFIGNKNLLLLVDNCEHVIDAIAEFVDRALGRCPSLTVLATSREALAVPREVQVTVSPLPAPPAGTPAVEVLDHPAAELFVERARAVRPDLVLDERELLDVAVIARALDGIPLALELAAARMKVMSTAEIRERLDHRFSLLTTGARTAATRQRTLRATVDWSYALLEPAEQWAFERLSVCHGGWTLETAEALVGEGDALTLISRLVEQSVVVVDRGGTSRYRMLATLREYAAERLAERGAGHEVAELHARHFSALAGEFESRVRGSRQHDALELVRSEVPNIEAAVDWFVSEGDVDAALVVTAQLALFWQLKRPVEGREILGRLLRDGRGTAAARGRALQALSIVERPRASLVHPSRRCAEAAAASLEIFEELGDAPRAALSKVLLAVEGVAGTSTQEEVVLLAEADSTFAAMGPDGEWGRAYVAYVRMEIALKHGSPEDAAELGHAAAGAFRRIDDQWGLSGVLQHLGRGMREYGRYDEADALLQEALVSSKAAGKDATIPWLYAEIGFLRALGGQRARAEEAFRNAVTASQRVGDGAGDALAAHGTGLIRQLDHDWDVARASYGEAIEGFRAQSTPEMEAFALCNRADCHEALGDDERARSDYLAALELGRTWHEPAVIASALEGLARSARRLGDARAAADLVSEARSVRERTGRVAHALGQGADVQ